MMKISYAIFLITVFIMQNVSAHAGFTPYGRIYKAAKDDRAYLTQAQDSRLQLKLRKSLFLKDSSTLMSISSYVFLGHGFLVGETESETVREELIESAKKVSGLSGISFYLPVKNADQAVSETSSALEIKLGGMFEPDYPSSKLTIKVVQNAVVVLGILAPEEQKKVLESLKKISGSNKIINFLQAPVPGESKRQRRRPLRDLFN
ncbi:BON domain-containing protein [Maridesulfovibrio hydrothermalis]|uniref:BON domain-containing protein n=1 Tax=Maridesulfovibrio hydrothermalis AM13 = DSM 14728 TaxID=1121451 RepID=L0RDT7_9BACT|nr:hypothetical protein [Maridesulfovibrio hydrothermalis]CCO23741.1 conserved exported protein of unknown function [Maridesulfovibrio hydrothermalis AM13 = DSM 14728]